MSSSLHWAAHYIGLPWRAGARGPQAYDCWGLFLAIQCAQFGRQLPEIPVDATDLRAIAGTFKSHPERQHWALVTVPSTGDAVLMRHSKFPSHVGIWLDVDGGGVLHCVRGEGVVFSSMTSLKFSGWSNIEFFTHESRT